MAAKQVTVQYEPVIKKTTGPLLVTFNNPPPPSVIEDAENQLQFKCMYDEKKKKRKVLVAETEKIDYSGDNFTNVDNSSKYLIGIYSKSKGTLKVIDNSPHFFQLTQIVKNYQEHHQDVDLKENIVRGRASKMGLTQKFGSRKANAVLNQQISNSLFKTSKSVMNNVETNVAEYNEENEDTEDSVKKHLPPHDDKTKVVSEIYKISDLLDGITVDDIDITEFTAYIDSYYTTGKFPEGLNEQFIHYMLAKTNPAKKTSSKKRKLEESSDEESDKEKSEDESEDEKEKEEEEKEEEEEEEPITADDTFKRHLLLYHYLVQFYLTSHKFNESKQNIPESLLKQLRKKFRENNKAVIKNIIAFHTIILALHLNKFRVDANIIADDLGIQANQCIPYLQSVGCKRMEKGSSDFQLKAPLKVLEPKNRSRKK